MMVSAQNLREQAQVYQQQIASIMAQKENLSLQLLEIRRALGELEKASGEVYRVAGPILIKSDVPSVKKDLKEKEDMLDLRLKTLEKGEKRMTAKMEELRGKLSKPSGHADDDGAG
ncbi:MAG: prefoldin subunit beta [Candidatus Aenigmarchaeota archaeon]|nr:prefoldin subunit beta [Candidatus Aenigmarchaeota archaeon]